MLLYIASIHKKYLLKCTKVGWNFNSFMVW